MYIEESLNEFAKRGRPRKNKNIKKSPKIGGIDTTDDWDVADDEDIEDIDDMDVDASDMENVETLDINDESYDDELFKALKNELKVPEFNRRTVVFRLKGDLGQVLQGIPMAKMGESSFLFKLNNGMMKKIALKDVILEQERYDSRARLISEEMEDRYLGDRLYRDAESDWPQSKDMEDEWYDQDEDDDIPYPGGLTQDDYENDEDINNMPF